MIVLGSAGVLPNGPRPVLDQRATSGEAAAEQGNEQTRSVAPDTGPAESEQSRAAREEELRQLQEFREIQALQARDREVRAHEQAHSAVGGSFAGAPSFTFQRGPDGRLYAIGGEVPIDASPIPGNPQATLAKAQQVQRAALAPADPSTADRRIAATAQSLAAEARQEIARQRAEALRQRLDERIAGTNSSQQEEQDPVGSHVDVSA